MWIGCYDWSARKILWVAWTWNALVQTIWGLLAVVQGQKISKLYDTFEENDRTSANLVTGIVATCAWAVVLIGLFLIFSLVVLLRKTIAKTGAGFSYGLIVGSAIHMFFVLGEAGVSLYSHERWLNDLGDAVWTGKDNEMFAAVAGFGLFAACCFLVLAILMIVYMSAVMEDKKEPLSSFRDRYGLGPSGGSSSQAV
mmetsp:Transcript_10844/g.45556  ORF Transcript_10844/g.45556 Transcript_10844/m.45556 type:complete len:197 (+) Transcript_10844:50-640(+)